MTSTKEKLEKLKREREKLAKLSMSLSKPKKDTKVEEPKSDLSKKFEEHKKKKIETGIKKEPEKKEELKKVEVKEKKGFSLFRKKPKEEKTQEIKPEKETQPVVEKKEEPKREQKKVEVKEKKGFSLFRKKPKEEKTQEIKPEKETRPVVEKKEEKPKAQETKKEEKDKEVKKEPEAPPEEVTKESSRQLKKEIKEEEKKETKKKKRSSYQQKKFFENLIEKSGLEHTFGQIAKTIAISSLIPVILATIFLTIQFVVNKTFVWDAITLLLSIWIFGTATLFLVLWIIFFVYVDLRMIQRRKEVEAVFPDFLQLTAANINAGMPIDRALWFAIRPRFGILAREMETVAKATMVGENLNKALYAFSDKYDSITIKRALNLLLEGLESGGEVGDLLTKVANNIRDTEILKKEMASNVTTYVIFILFATLGAAPFLFGLTTELIVIMSSILGNIQIGESGQSTGGVGGMMTIGGDIIAVSDYKIFAITSIVITSIFAGILVSVIKKGSAKEAFKQIPLYVAIGVTNYFIAFTLLNYFLGSMFA